jgi:VCBS repeat-containing protein
LANDTDVDSTVLSTSLVNGPRHGWLTHNSDGTFSYTAAWGYVGTDSFTYRTNDGQLDSAVATVTLTVTGNHRPVANDDTVTTKEDTAVRINVLANDTDADGDALQAYVSSGPQHGYLRRNDDGAKGVRFTYNRLNCCGWVLAYPALATATRLHTECAPTRTGSGPLASFKQVNLTSFPLVSVATAKPHACFNSIVSSRVTHN